MERKEVIISDLSSAVIEKDRLSPVSSPDRWECTGYSTKDIKGSFLFAGERTSPPPLTIDPKLGGWYRIYVCMADFGGAFASHIDLRLTSDEYSRSMRAGDIGRYVVWSKTEAVEESFWRCADMTGQSVTVSKIDTGLPFRANIFWLRFEPMSDDEVTEYLSKRPSKTMLAHMDGDFHALDGAKEPKDYCKAIYNMRHSAVGIVSQEVMNDLIDYDSPAFRDLFPRDDFTKTRVKYFERMSRNRRDIYEAEIKCAHEGGMKLIAAHRMPLSNFAFPYNQPYFEIPFVTEHPEYRCESRFGVPVGFLSYAYSEVREFMLSTLMESAEQGFDGVELLFTRGVCLMFERPVAEIYRGKYPDGPDYSLLPPYDQRVYEARCAVMTGFIRELRRRLDDHAAKTGHARFGIYVTGYHTVCGSRQNGLDFETLAAEGLIDGIIQSNMSVWEESDDCVGPDGLIDREKYERKADSGYIADRYYTNDPKRIAVGAGEYGRLADRYGIEMYSELQWESTVPPEEYVKAAKKIIAGGGKRIALWDCVPARLQSLSEWAAVSGMGDAASINALSDDGSAYRSAHRLTMIGGQDLRYANPTWRG